KPAFAPSDFPTITIKVHRRRHPRQTIFSTADSSERWGPSGWNQIPPPDPFTSTPSTIHHHRRHRNRTLEAQKAMALILVAAPICQAMQAISMTTFSKPLCTLEQIWTSCNAMA
ncbi:hypothetical protein PFISCL1PPCAC_23982, partial [Pristionchus fissidentatus]